MASAGDDKLKISFYRIVFRATAPFIFILLLYGCAQIVKPTGGPKDTTPPKALNFLPENKSILFNSKKIVIRFNKYIQLKDIQNQLVISPPLKNFPKVTVVGGKSMEITIKDTLHDSTTYTFNFGNSIADITEGNILHNFRYVFSTGAYLDSLSLTGKIIDAFTQTPIKDGIIMLYSSANDSAPYKMLPYYYARSDEKGAYKIENIKEGTYRVIALSKTGTDYFYHPYTEEIGFINKPIKIKANDTANLSLFTEINAKVHVLKTKALEQNRILIVFNAPADSTSIKPLNLASDTIYYSYLQYSQTADTVNYWLYTPRLDSLKFIVKRNNKVLDTSVISYFPGKVHKKVSEKPPLNLILNVHNNQQDFDYHSAITIQSPYPIAKIKRGLIYLTKRKDTLRFTEDTSGLPFSIALHSVLEGDSAYQLFIAPGVFTDYSGRVNDTIKYHFITDMPTFFGTLKLNLKVTRTIPYIVQLLDAHGNVARQDNITDSSAMSPSGGKGVTLNYDALPPANYTIRVIDNVKGTGKWTTGNYMKGIQPAKVYYFPQTITIRSDWDVVQNWQVP